MAHDNQDNRDSTLPSQLVDRLGRRHENLRISVTDRCNLRCRYCMPEHVEFLPRAEILSFEEFERFTRVAVSMGIRRLRITGGEPLMRRDLPELISRLSSIDGIDDLALTTNGVLLSNLAKPLRDAGLHRLNISLDSVRREVFEKWTRRDALDQTIAGIEAAQTAGFDRIRINAVAIEGMTEQEIVPLVQFARSKKLELRFIEFMPIDGDEWWHSGAVMSGAAIREVIEDEFGPLSQISTANSSQPATDYRLTDGTRIGLICSITEPFCESCDRLRITAEGQVRNCLFSQEEWDVRGILRGGGSDDDLRQLMLACIGAKKAGHGTDDPQMQRPNRPMYQIGG